jgi:hypothetical protein
MHGKLRENKRRRALIGQSAVGPLTGPWFRHPGLQFVASLSPIEDLVICGLATFHEVANKPPAVDNGGSDAASGI